MAKTFSWNLEYKDSTPKLNVMHSAFEHWFQAQPFATQSGIKQMCRDSYAAGMGDPLVTYAEPEEIKGASGDTLKDFSADQWWVKELEAIAKDTPDQKRAIAVLHNLLETITHV